MDDSHFNSSYFWSPVPTVQGQVDNLIVGIVLKCTWCNGEAIITLFFGKNFKDSVAEVKQTVKSFWGISWCIHSII